MKKGIFGFSVRDIAEIAILVALAVICDKFLKIPLGPTGGSINASMILLFIIALRHGWFKTLISGGVVFGLITCLTDGYGFYTYPFEYLVPFGSICLISLFTVISDKQKSLLTRILVFVGVSSLILVIRFFFNSLDSVIWWDYTWSAAFVYNLSYVFISGAICIAATSLLFPLIDKINNIYKSDYLKALTATKIN